MNRLVLVALASTMAVAGMASAAHVIDCTIRSADPASYLTFDFTEVGGGILYDEERGNPFGVPIPLSAAFIGAGPDGDGSPFGDAQGSWFYEEANGAEGLQRGGPGAVFGGWWPHGCDQDWDLMDGTVPCLVLDQDPMTDEVCGHGHDRLVAWVWGERIW